jgi:uncharacterized protein YggE
VVAGGNPVRVQGITFGIENPETALAEAREKAYANAKIKAEQYAKMAGLTLGAPLHISEGSDMSPMPRSYAAMKEVNASDSASTPVQVGEQEVTVTVEVMFGI